MLFELDDKVALQQKFEKGKLTGTLIPIVDEGKPRGVKLPEYYLFDYFNYDNFKILKVLVNL